ncbi:hypothetical protein B7463_g3467, partial [Scytalidium lignicola]
MSSDNPGSRVRAMARSWAAARLPLGTRAEVCGCYLVGTDLRQQHLPLFDCEAHTTIISRSYKTVLKQTFVNSSSENDAECTYKFPLYDSVSVVTFKCRIGSKPALCGVVKEKKKAEAIFNTAAAKGDNVSLFTQAPEASDVFSIRIGNVTPGENVFVEITYIDELKYDDSIEGICFTIPTVVAPRYSPPGSLNPLSVMTPLPHHLSGRISITVDIVLSAGEYIKGIESPSHLIAVSIGIISTATQAVPMTNKASVTLSLRSAILEKDFILIIRSKDTGTSKALLETHSSILNHRALMITLASKISLPSSSPSEIVIIADRSSSMVLNISMLISTFKVFLKSMPTNVKFNICSFGTNFTFLWPQSKSYTNETVQEAIKHVLTFDAKYGRKELLQAIQATIERQFADLPLDIILFTNGNITDHQSLFTYVNKQVEKSLQASIRLFSVGIGNRISHALIEGVARAGNGFCLAVQDGERLEKSVSFIIRGALSLHIGDCVLEVQYGQDDGEYELVDKPRDSMEKLLPSAIQEVTTSSLVNPSIEPTNISLPDTHHFPEIIQAPHKIPLPFIVARKTIYLLMSPKTIQRNPMSIILRSTSFPGGPPLLEIPIEVLPDQGTTIHQLAARKASQDLEESPVSPKEGEEILIENTTSFLQDLPIRALPLFQLPSSAVGALSTGNPYARVSPVSVLENHRKRPWPVQAQGGNILSPQERGRDIEAEFVSYNTPATVTYSSQATRLGSNATPTITAVRLILPPNPNSTQVSEGQDFLRVQRAKQIAQQIALAKLASDAGITSHYNQRCALPTAQQMPPQYYDLSVLPSLPSPNLVKVFALIDHQCFNGAWTGDSEGLLPLLGFDIPMPPPAGVSDESWVTMLIVKFLEERMPGEEGV